MLTRTEKIGEAQPLALFISWLKVAIQALRAGKLRPGQVLALAGPPGLREIAAAEFHHAVARRAQCEALSIHDGGRRSLIRSCFTRNI